MADLTKEQGMDILRSILKEWEKGNFSIAEAGYEVVGRLGSNGLIEDFPEIFDLASDIELDKARCENFEEKAEKLKILIKNL